MARSGLIYKITSPSGKVYIGQTINLKNRVKQYRVYENYKGRKQPKLFNVIKKYGWENFKLEVVEEDIVISKLDEKERKYIKEYNSFLDGLNCTSGGGVLRGSEHPLFGRKVSQETKIKISQTMKGRKASQEAKDNMSIARKGLKQPKISQIQVEKKRKPFTAEHIENMSKAQKIRRLKEKAEEL